MAVVLINTATYGLLTVFTILSLYVIWFYKGVFDYWKKRGLEYMEPSIPFGNMQSLYTRKNTFGEMFANFYLHFKEKGLRHGGIYFFWRPMYIPVDPEIIKRILISDFENFPNHGLYINEKNDPLSGHLFNMENTKWRTLRAKMPSAFTSAKMRKMFLVMDKMTKQLVKNLDKYAETGKVVDIKREASRFTTDVISACALGIETKTMTNENEDMIKIGRSFFDYQWNVYKNTMVLVFPRNLLQKFSFRIMTKELEKFFINLCKNIVNYRKENPMNKADITDTLLKLTQKSDQERDFTGKATMEPLNFEEFSAQMLIFFAAGFETSSSTQTFAMYELAKNPEIQRKLREDINKTLENHNEKITYDAIMDMKYLENVVDETLRKYPIFPIIPRVCIKDYKVPGTEFTIEEGTFVVVSNMGIHRDPEYYPDPENFDPERFTSENKSKRPFAAYLPFGEGPRVCLGKRFGLLQTKLGLATIIRNYEISLNTDKTTSSFKFVTSELMLRKTGDIWLNLKKINT